MTLEAGLTYLVWLLLGWFGVGLVLTLIGTVVVLWLEVEAQKRRRRR